MKEITGTINWGIIGCGDVCEVKSGPAFYKISGSKLVAVMRRDAGKAKDFALRHGVSSYYSKAADLINDPEVNAVYIATPPSSHEQYLEMALKAGKQVYVEKPVSTDAASVERMIALQKVSGGKVSVAHYRRSLPLFKTVKQLILEEAIGNIKLVLLKILQPPASKIITQTTDNWRINPDISGGGLFHDLSPHQLDILYWIFGKPQKVNVQAANQGKRYHAPDSVSVEALFNTDIQFCGIWNFNVAESATEDDCEMIGDKGSIRFSFFRISTIELTTGGKTEIIRKEYPVHIQQPHIEQVIRYFRGEAENPCSLEEALVTMQIMDKASL